MPSKADINIDENKLRHSIRSRGLNVSVMQHSMGRTNGYFKKIFSRGTMTKSCMIMLDQMYGIKPDEYVVAKPVVIRPDELKDKTEVTVQLDALYTVIYDAIYHAIRNALDDDTSKGAQQ